MRTFEGANSQKMQEEGEGLNHSSCPPLSLSLGLLSSPNVQLAVMSGQMGLPNEIRENRVLLLWRKIGSQEMATHSSALAWRIPGTGVLPSVGSQRVGHDWSDLAAAAGSQERAFLILYHTNNIFMFSFRIASWVWNMAPCLCLSCCKRNICVRSLVDGRAWHWYSYVSHRGIISLLNLGG